MLHRLSLSFSDIDQSFYLTVTGFLFLKLFLLYSHCFARIACVISYTSHIHRFWQPALPPTSSSAQQQLSTADTTTPTTHLDKMTASFGTHYQLLPVTPHTTDTLQCDSHTADFRVSQSTSDTDIRSQIAFPTPTARQDGTIKSLESGLTPTGLPIAAHLSRLALIPVSDFRQDHQSSVTDR